MTGAEQGLDEMVENGDLIRWVEIDDTGTAFECWRLNPDRFPDRYKDARAWGWKP